MDVGFSSPHIAKVCSNAGLRVRRLGPERADKVLRRLDQMTAAHDLAEFRDLPQARCHQLKGDLDEQFSVDLDGPYRLLFEVADSPIPRLPDGGIDLKSVRAIRVIDIQDTH